MAEENYPQPPAAQVNASQKPAASYVGENEKFPKQDDTPRLMGYEFYERLFFGQHFQAFKIKISDERYSKEYEQLRYITANFAGLISKTIADLLFIEPPKIKLEDGDQEWVDELISQNQLRIKNYESALSNSYFGDALFKLRIGKRNPADTETTIIIEEVTPKIYFPDLNPFNVKEQPSKMVLAWTFNQGATKYLRKEIHTPGQIENQIWEMKGDELISQIANPESIIPGLKSIEDTKIKRMLLIHIPNWRAGNRHFGISDYFDLDSLFYSINNRLTKVDNILDKHSDPILALPDGVLDENGKVRKSQLGLFIRPEDATKEQDPAYVTWEANLEWAIAEVDKLIEVLMMMSETAPALMGLDKGGVVESGRALKYKILRTLAKAQRKQLYYREGLIEVIYTAQLLGKAWDIKFNGKGLTGDAIKPEIVWADGLPADQTEQVDIETKRIDAGLTTPTDAIMRLDDIDEDSAAKKAKEIADSGKQDLMNQMMLKGTIGADGKPINKDQNGSNNNNQGGK